MTSEMVPAFRATGPDVSAGRLHACPAPLARIRRRASAAGIAASSAPAATPATELPRLVPAASSTIAAAASPAPASAPSPASQPTSACDLDLAGRRQGERALGEAAGDEQPGAPQRRRGRRRAVVECHAAAHAQRDERDPDAWPGGATPAARGPRRRAPPRPRWARPARRSPRRRARTHSAETRARRARAAAMHGGMPSPPRRRSPAAALPSHTATVAPSSASRARIAARRSAHSRSARSSLGAEQRGSVDLDDGQVVAAGEQVERGRALRDRRAAG